MTLRRAHRVDWRRQFEQIELYAQERSGVIHVHAGGSAPSSVFAKVLRHYLVAGSWAKPWVSVQVDPANSNTHYVRDIVDQIQRTCNLQVPIRPGAPASVIVGADISTSGGAVTISDVSIDVGMSQAAMVSAVCDGLREKLKTHRVAMVFLDTHDAERRYLNGLWSGLWENGLEALTDAGLLVIDIFDPRVMSKLGASWPPSSDCTLVLPETLAEDEKEAAYEDLAQIALNEGLCDSPGQADIFARTLLVTTADVRDLHARLAMAVAGLR